MVKLVAAVRSHEERSTNVFIDVEDGTGFTQIKVWINEGDECSAITQLRQAASTDHSYIRIIGQVKEYDGQRQIVANDVRPVSSGNELTYHLLEVAHSYEKSIKMQSENANAVGGGGMFNGIGNMANAPPQAGGMGVAVQGGSGGGMGGGSALNDAVVQAIQTMGGEFLAIHRMFALYCCNNFQSNLNHSFISGTIIAENDSGVHMDRVAQQLSSQGFSEGDVKNAINHLSNEGHIYSTIDEYHFQYAM